MNTKKPLVINQPEVSQFIRELRLLTKLTQEKFAIKIGVTCLTISRWENGRSQPSPLAMEKVEGILEEMGDTPSESLRDRAEELRSKYF
ncbi:helix-turn-helix transcriptional regulator [Rivularia sp. UHCC 0363]|uniref:helix-turn-helix domain-containing protein n=1 Tax=Rivularia sp. UHCC 0363 TaxID=3110244 RepID=UPI002B1F5EC4|nr:helix-turn-helix transcriptional regulator [Rivularia sp. UHCC 0363]MEA5595731.1 helix-turn-helix transcriptional regulator [Rivularia sp. UHCC 0363]